MFLGGGGVIEAVVERGGVPFREISTGKDPQEAVVKEGLWRGT